MHSMVKTMIAAHDDMVLNQFDAKTKPTYPPITKTHGRPYKPAESLATNLAEVVLQPINYNDGNS